MAINSNRNFRSQETKRRYRVEDRYRPDMAARNKGHKYMAMIWDEEIEMYAIAVNGLGDSITGRTIADVQRAVNIEDFWITPYDRWLKSK